MKHLPLILMLCLAPVGTALADGGHHHQSAAPQASVALSNEVKTNVSITGNTLTITYGPLDLPTGHDGELAASIPKHIFQLPQDRFLVGYKSAVFTKDGTPLPRQYLHHILLINLDKEGVSCPGEPLFFAGAGLEMNETKFPSGYGVKLGKDQKLMTIVAFYHGAPPTKDVMATFTMELAPKGTPMQELDVYQVGVNVVCYSKFDNRRQDESDEGIEIQPGVQVDKAPLKFRMDGCVKFAYPHAHDQALLIALENKTRQQTLLRTVPEVDSDGTFRSFQPHQVYQNEQGFEVNTQDDYELVMVHHRPLQAPLLHHGMGNYLLYMTAGKCPSTQAALNH
ncbi:MAG: hypothetical protein EPO64_09920 [Nitrospirae bacterium]|nr:MAG: hypothetical protein EPO64_09920 [Nitrospirota bacterium]